MRLLRVIIFLAVAGVIALVGYAYLGDMTADPRPIRVPVELDLGTAAPAPPSPAPAAQPAPAAAPEEQGDPDALD